MIRCANGLRNHCLIVEQMRYVSKCQVKKTARALHYDQDELLLNIIGSCQTDPIYLSMSGRCNSYYPQ